MISIYNDFYSIPYISPAKKKLISFLKRLNEMTLCPITRQEMTNPYISTDMQSYERTAISMWLDKRRISPITRAPMEMHCLMPDYSMSRLISSMKEFSISTREIENMESLYPSIIKESNSTRTKPSPTPEGMPIPPTDHAQDATAAVNKKSQKRKRKAARLKSNQNTKKRALKVLERHCKYLKEMDMYNEVNFKPSMPTTPSFSIMHSLEEGFSILMYSGSHRVRLNPNLCLHNYNAVRIILPEWMCIIWHESLFHAGARSRQSIDMRFFSYVWPLLPSSTGQRTHGTMDGVARELGDQVYRENINSKICVDIYKDSPNCINCRKWEETLDLRGIPPTSYAAGERIIGSLDSLGWVVVRGVRITKDTYIAIENISKLGVRGKPTKKGSWTSIEDRGNNRKMKYKLTCSPKGD